MKITYKDFASNISFFEFLEEEFTKYKFPRQKYETELELINGIKNINDLAKSLEKYPKLFFLYEGYFQLSTFSVAQFTNFLFDVQKLNYDNEKSLENYSKSSCFQYENGESNEKFKYYYDKVKDESFSKYSFKKAVANYINYLQNSKIGDTRRVYLLKHISKNISTRVRIAEYLINRYNLLEHSTENLIEKTLLLKRHSVDSKSFSGQYGSYRIERCLKESGFTKLPANFENTLDLGVKRNLDGFHYIREAKISSTIKKLSFDNKVFDFILLKNGTPFFLIETNFYSTSGSKIRINEGQYIELSENIKSFSTSQANRLYFSWITDGNYWLSTGGLKRWKKIRKKLDMEYEMLNYSLFEKNLSEIKNLI